MTGGEGFVGIDVSKARLDVALGGADNDAHGIVGRSRGCARSLRS
jgi:hypothetical protein